MQSAGRLDLLNYPPPEGYPLHREMGVHWLARSGITVDQSRVVVTAGAQAGDHRHARPASPSRATGCSSRA